jgi:hypothetical protein
MVQADTKIGGKRDPGQWLHIDDFSPGCFDPSNTSTESPVTNQPPGAADITGTFACSVVKGGSLGPLPGFTNGLQFSAYGGLQGGSTQAVLVGFIVTPQLNDGNYEIIAIFEMDDGTDHYVVAASYEPGDSVNLISGPTNTSPTTGPGIFGAPYPAFTRANADGSAGPPPPGPLLVFPMAISTDSSGPGGHLWIYPELDDPTSYTAQDLIVADSSITGQLITYGDRIICIVGVDYDWPAGGGINTNENFNYCDPPESTEYGNQQTIFSPEEPWGYGAWGSQSVGELLLVKKYGGAVLLNGDINVPSSVIPLPGVESVGDFVGRAAATPIGLVYCAQNRGAWLWNGGNTSQKISQAIADNFFDLEHNVIESNNYGFFVEHWQKWIMFSGNVWYDTDSGSWWNIYPKNGTTIGSMVGRDMFWYCLTRNGNQLLAAPLILRDNSANVWSTLDNTTPSETYQWKSLPIHVTENADRVVDIRSIIVRCSDPADTGAATITVSTPNGSFSSTTVAADNPIGPNPTILRFNVGLGAQGLQDIVVQIYAENSGAGAPIIESIDVEYKVRAPEAVAN